MVDALYGQVVRIIRNHLPRATDEQDLAQEVFMKIFAHLDRYRAEQPFPHWVSRITVNTCYDRLRRQKARPEVRFADLREEEAAYVENTLAQSETTGTPPSAETHEIIQRLLATLKPDEQIVLRMLDLEQKSVKEIASLTGWGESKIKVTAMRARRKLNATLQKMEGGQPHE